MKDGQTPAPSQSLVAGRGFAPDGALIGYDGSRRYFLEVAADPDRPEARPREALRAIVQALPPGWALRVLRLAWPDAARRREFMEQVGRRATPAAPLRGVLREAFLNWLAAAPLPIHPRTVLEIAVPPAEKADPESFLETVLDLCRAHNVEARRLSPEEVADLARSLLNPEV